MKAKKAMRNVKKAVVKIAKSQEAKELVRKHKIMAAEMLMKTAKKMKKEAMKR